MELVIRNRRLIESDLTTIRSLIQIEGAQGRSHLSRRLCRLWEWRQANGAYREIVCRDLLRQLENRGLIELPPALHAARRPGYKNRVQAPGVATDPMEVSMAWMKPEIRIVPVETAPQRHLLRDLLAAYHYLGYQQHTGASMGYLIFWRDRPLACARFGPAAWKVAARDHFIGWTSEQRRLGLKGLVNNDRFLILPWVKVAHLASFLLGKLCKRLARDWWSVYQESIVLAETFVDSQRFEGTCYRAANWLCLGQSRGRGRNDREHQSAEPLKSVWCRPLITKPPTGGGGSSSPRKIGGQPGHRRHERPAFPADQIDERKIHGLKQCPDCGSGDLEVLPEPAQVVQQVELLSKPFKVTEHRVQACRCRNCQRIQTGQLPAAIAATGLIGPRMMGLLLFMKGAMRSSYTAIEEFLDHVMGFKVCRGYLAKVMVRGSQALEAPVEELRLLLPVQRLLNVDETGHKENGEGMWTWCFRAGNFVLFSIQASRGSDVLMEFLGEEFNGVLGCDYFSAYRKFMGKMSGSVQFCFAHLIRDLKFMDEHPELIMQIYAQPILRAIRRMFHLIHQQVEKPAADFQSQLERQKKRIIALAGNTACLSPIEWCVKKQYPEVFNMAERFRKHGEAYFTFITTPEIGPTNNAAEQALRFVVMDRRATQGTRSHKGRAFCERIWTVVGTCRLNKQSIFDYLCEAVTAWASGLRVPSLIPVPANSS